MTLNPFKWWRERKLSQQRAENRLRALRGETTSAHLSEGDRAHIFRYRNRLRRKP